MRIIMLMIMMMMTLMTAKRNQKRANENQATENTTAPQHSRRSHKAVTACILLNAASSDKSNYFLIVHPVDGHKATLRQGVCFPFPSYPPSLLYKPSNRPAPIPNLLEAAAPISFFFVVIIGTSKKSENFNRKRPCYLR